MNYQQGEDTWASSSQHHELCKGTQGEATLGKCPLRCQHR